MGVANGLGQRPFIAVVVRLRSRQAACRLQMASAARWRACRLRVGVADSVRVPPDVAVAASVLVDRPEWWCRGRPVASVAEGDGEPVGLADALGWFPGGAGGLVGRGE